MFDCQRVYQILHRPKMSRFFRPFPPASQRPKWTPTEPRGRVLETSEVLLESVFAFGSTVFTYLWDMNGYNTLIK